VSKSITTILFDAGGTLIHIDLRFIHRLLRRAGVTATLQLIRKAECASKKAIDLRMKAAVADTDETRRQPYFAAMLGHLGLNQEQIDHILRLIEAEHQQHNLWRVMLPSTPEVLASLQERGIRLGVVSNSDGRIFSLLDQSGIAKFFHIVVDSHHVGVEKPDPRIFQFALKKLKARPEQTIYVGDIYSIDVVGAERAGLHPVLTDRCGCYDSIGNTKIKRLSTLLSMVA